MANESFDYRNWLVEEFSIRRQRNRSYSLRAFARALDVSPASLSQVLSGKRHFSVSSALRVAEAFSLSPALKKRFVTSVILQSSTRSFTTVESASYKNLELSTFSLISHWYYYAILSLASTEKNFSDPAIIAKYLGIGVVEARLALRRLTQLGLISISKGRMRQDERPLAVSAPQKNHAIRAFHHQLLDLAKESIDQTATQDRELGALTLAFDKKNMPKAVELIKSFRREFNESMDTGSGQEVYQLCVQFFPLTK